MMFSNIITSVSVGLGYCHKFFKDRENPADAVFLFVFNFPQDSWELSGTCPVLTEVFYCDHRRALNSSKSVSFVDLKMPLTWPQKHLASLLQCCGVSQRQWLGLMYLSVRCCKNPSEKMLFPSLYIMMEQEKNYIPQPPSSGFFWNLVIVSIHYPFVSLEPHWAEIWEQ